MYALNRWVVAPRVSWSFLHYWFDDLLLIPCALPPLLAVHRALGLRRHDGPPTVWEIAGHLVFWSVLFEWIGPHLVPRASGDPWDVVAYTIGAAVAAVWWHRDALRRMAHPEPGPRPAEPAEMSGVWMEHKTGS